MLTGTVTYCGLYYYGLADNIVVLSIKNFTLPFFSRMTARKKNKPCLECLSVVYAYCLLCGTYCGLQYRKCGLDDHSVVESVRFYLFYFFSQVFTDILMHIKNLSDIFLSYKVTPFHTEWYSAPRRVDF